MPVKSPVILVDTRKLGTLQLGQQHVKRHLQSLNPGTEIIQLPLKEEDVNALKQEPECVLSATGCGRPLMRKLRQLCSKRPRTLSMGLHSTWCQVHLL